MKLITKEIEKNMPGPRAMENVEDPVCVVKFFHPATSWTWFAYEAWRVIVDAVTGDFIDERKLSEPLKPNEKEEDIIFFGMVHGFEKELGTFSLNELQSLHHGQSGFRALPVERDLHWKPKRVSEVDND